MAKDEKKKPQGGKNDNPVIKDERFKSVHNDPRFKLPNLKNFKIKVDERFSKKELNKLNAGALGKKVKIDRYGRKIDADKNKGALDKFYEHEEDEDEQDEEAEISGSEGDDESSDSEGEDVETLTAKLQEEQELDRARGEGLESSSEEESSESESESDEDSVVFEEEESEIELEEGKPEEGDATSSFAVVNMDWDNLRAVDLMATFISFVPKGGSIKSVTIYPSEFGKERMQQEEIEGPPRDLFKSKKKKNQEESSDSEIDSDIDINNADELAKVTKKLYETNDDSEDYDSKALRRYQLQRLRYYYAIVKCDSVQTSKNIYQNCDGTEYESTANIFDLRYVPEDMEFEDEAKDKCTKIPASYRPDSTFVTDALQHSKVKLTWDETPKERLTLSSRPLSQKEIDENDFKAYLASDSDGSEEEPDLKDKYQSLLGNGFGKKFGKDDEEDDVDMEITFDPGLKDNKEEEDEKDQDETTIDAYRRKEKERRKRRMAKFKESKEAEAEEETESKPKSKSKSKSKKHAAPPLDEKSRAELELVLMDEENADKPDHFNMKDVVKSEKLKGSKKKNKKNNKKIDDEMTQDNFVANLNDPRFKEIFESHEYAIDPTSSEFKKTETMKQILKERSIRADKAKHSETNKKRKHNHVVASGNEDARSLADKIKKKHKTK
ncbi:Pre-rRNA-processing protein ESF1 [Spathaspora sp. JA1]|nr:Pre-rRNA-processing protein ESF1 [Spathaspora sp. JA1]